MSRRRLAWVIPFLTVTALAIAGELWAAFDHNPDTMPWTDLIVRYIPAPITYALIGVLVVWLPAHFLTKYHDARRAHVAALLTAPTQTRYPWRATLRTAFAFAFGLVVSAPDIARTLGVEHTPWGVRALAVSAAITRVMAIPGVDEMLRQYVPWLGSAPVPKTDQGGVPVPPPADRPVDMATVRQAAGEAPPTTPTPPAG